MASVLSTCYRAVGAIARQFWLADINILPT
jgi:hypothetical protein